MPKSDLATISPIMLIIGLILPALASNIVTSYPLTTFIWGTICKMITTGSLWATLQYIPSAYASNATPSYIFFGSLMGAMFLNECAGTFISMMSFFSKISDPSIGGSYMTLLNTIANWGYKWPSILVLWLIPKLTISFCQDPSKGSTIDLEDMCHAHHAKECHSKGGKCVDTLDGYTVLTLSCLLLGLLWLLILRTSIQKLETLHHSNWMIENTKST